MCKFMIGVVVRRVGRETVIAGKGLTETRRLERADARAEFCRLEDVGSNLYLLLLKVACGKAMATG